MRTTNNMSCYHVPDPANVCQCHISLITQIIQLNLANLAETLVFLPGLTAVSILKDPYICLYLSTHQKFLLLLCCHLPKMQKL